MVAAVAREQGIEFAAIKAVSDEFGFAMPPLGQFVDRAGQFASGPVRRSVLAAAAAMVARRWPDAEQ